MHNNLNIFQKIGFYLIPKKVNEWKSEKMKKFKLSQLKSHDF